MNRREKYSAKLAEILGYQVKGKTIYGINNGYHFSLNLLSHNNILTYQVSILVDKVMSLDNIKNIRKELKSVVSINEENKAYLLQALVNFPTEDCDKKVFFEDFMVKLTNALKKEDIHEYKDCVLCSDDIEKNEDNWSLNNGLYIFAHNSCIKEEAIVEKDNMHKLFNSIILGIIGSFVGLIPAILALLFTDYFIGVLYALSPICSYLLYKLGKAPLKWYTTLNAALSSLIATCIVIICFFAISASINKESLFDYISNPDRECYSILFQSIIFDAIGIAISWGYITKVNHN